MSDPPAWHLRPATEHDVPALAALYADAARTAGPWCYTPQQVNAWASFAADTQAFRGYVTGADTWVAEAHADARLLGFCGVDAQGEVRSLYVAPDLHRRGLGATLLRHALEVAERKGVRRFTAWATPFSKPVFERAGFVLERVVREPYQGVLFDRYRLRRD